jgi:hypothetical protein
MSSMLTDATTWDVLHTNDSTALKKQLLASMLCPTFEVFQAVLAPFIFGKQVSSPSKRIKKHGRKALFAETFGKRLSYLRIAELLCENSERIAYFSIDQLLSTIVILDPQLSGSLNEEAFTNIVDLIEDGVRSDPLRPEMIWQQVLLSLVEDVHSELLGMDDHALHLIRAGVKTARAKGYQPLKQYLLDVWTSNDCDLLSNFASMWKGVSYSVGGGDDVSVLSMSMSMLSEFPAGHHHFQEEQKSSNGWISSDIQSAWKVQ